MERRHAAIERLFHPRNVVLVGASDRPDHWSRRVFDNLKQFGFAGRVFPVNPNRSEIWGMPCFPDFAALSEAPDHLVLFTPAETSLRVLRDGGAAGAQSATLYAAGFGEGGDPEGLALAAMPRAALTPTARPCSRSRSARPNPCAPLRSLTPDRWQAARKRSRR